MEFNMTAPVLPEWVSNRLAQIYSQYQATGIFETADEFNLLASDPNYGSQAGLSKVEYELATELQALRQQFTAFSAQSAAPQSQDAAPKVSAAAVGRPVLLQGGSENNDASNAPAAIADAAGQSPDELLGVLGAFFEAHVTRAPTDIAYTPATESVITQVQVAYDLEAHPERQEFLDFVLKRLIIPMLRDYGITGLAWQPAQYVMDEETKQPKAVTVDTADVDALRSWYTLMLYNQNHMLTPK